MKICRKCGHEFSDGGRCKVCHARYHAEYAILNQAKLKANAAQYYIKNKERIKKVTLEYSKNNPLKRSLYAKTWRSKNIGWHVLWRNRNISARRIKESIYRNKNRDRIKKSGSAYAKKYPEKFRLKSMNRRAKILGLGGKLSANIVKNLLFLQKGLCACCNKPLGKDYHLDHRMPLALGGSNEDSNMQLLLSRCNQQKGALHPIDFMRLRGFLI